MKKVNKTLILICVIITVFMSIFLFGYDLDKKNQMKVIGLNKDIELTENKNEIDYNIDSIEISDGLCNIKGWAIIKGLNSYNVIPNIILKDDSGNLYKIKTRIIQRSDITELYNGVNTDKNTHLTCVTKSNLGVTKNKFVYDDCGIVSEVDASNLNKDESYKIGIQLETNDASYFVWTSSEFKL